MDTSSPFVPLLVMTLLAAIVPVLVSRVRLVRLPIVVGEILAGMIIGQSGLHLVRPSERVEFLAQFGFVFLMFLSGLEVSLDTLVPRAGQRTAGPRWQHPLALAGLIFAGTVGLAIALAAALVAAGLAPDPVLLGLILSTTSLGIVVPVLKERGITATPYGQVLLLTALISDFATLLLLSVTLAIASRGPGLDLLLVLVLFAAFAGAVRLGPRVTRLPGLARVIDELSHATAQIRVRGALALMIIWVVLAQALGVEVILGAFLAGATISLSGGRQESPLREKLDAIGFGFFIPLFFINVGATFDLGALIASPAALTLVPLLIAGAYGVKLLPALLLRTRFSWRETWAAGSLLAARLSLIIAASAIALDLGLISPALNAALVLVAVLTCTVSPLLFGRILGTAATPVGRVGVLVLGTGVRARLLAERLARAGESVTLLADDPTRLAGIGPPGVRVVSGPLADPVTLTTAGAGTARALIAVTDALPTLEAICRLARDQFAVPVVLASTDESAAIPALRALGVRVVQPTLATVLALESALRFPATFDLLTDPGDDVAVAEARLANPALAGQALRAVRLPADALVIGIRRAGEMVIPHGATVLQRDDILMLVGNPAGLPSARQWIEAWPAQQARRQARTGKWKPGSRVRYPACATPGCGRRAPVL